jgi:hypothetical protein
VSGAQSRGCRSLVRQILTSAMRGPAQVTVIMSRPRAGLASIKAASITGVAMVTLRGRALK